MECLQTKRKAQLQKTSVVIAVETAVTRFEIAVPYAVTGQQIFDEVVAALGVEETWWFGLSGTDFDGHKVWVKNKKKLGLQVPFNTEPVELSFDVKIYPQRVEDLIQDITVRLFYLHTKAKVLSGFYDADVDSLVSLAGYQAQERFGPFLPEIHDSFLDRYLKIEELFPESFLNSTGFPKSILEEKVKKMHKERGTMLSSGEDAMMFYLKTAERDVRGYGTALFEIGTKFEPHKLLSVSPSSITLSTADFKDEESFRWAEIRSAAQVDKKITIKLRSGREKSLTAKNSSEAKRVVNLIQNYKLLSVMMEAPPSPQVERLKIVADEEEKSKIFKREEISQTKRHFQVQNNLISELEEDRKNLSDKLDRMQNEKDIYEGEIVRLRENIQRIDREATRTLSQYRILREMIPKADPNDLARRVERYESLKKLEGKHERSNSQSIEKKPVVYQSMTRDRIRRGNTILLLKSLEEQFQK